MKSTTPITTLFLDVGGVLLTNGWGHQSRALAAKAFDLNLEEIEDRHHLTFDTYEVGKLTLEEYLSRTVLGFEVSVTRITSPRAHNWPRSASSMTRSSYGTRETR